jgi:hypothetical protein
MSRPTIADTTLSRPPITLGKKTYTVTSTAKRSGSLHYRHVDGANQQRPESRPDVVHYCSGSARCMGSRSHAGSRGLTVEKARRVIDRGLDDMSATAYVPGWGRRCPGLWRDRQADAVSEQGGV